MKRKRVTGIILGILAGVGGFVDFGGLIQYSQAGAQYQYALLWTLIPGVVGFAVYADMAGRVAISSGRTMYDVIRDRLGARLGMIPLCIEVVVHLLTLLTELAGMSLVLEWFSQISYLLWVPLMALLLGTIVWKARFDLMENSATTAGLCMIVAVLAMLKLGPRWGEIGSSVIHPALSTAHPLAGYLFSIVSLLGAYMTPYQFDFYSSGALEEQWNGEDLVTNRMASLMGTSFGSIISLALMVGAAMVLFPRHASVKTLLDAAQPVTLSLGSAGLLFFLVGAFAVSLGAGLEASLSGTYAMCQYFGWDWGKKGKPREAPLFHLGYIVLLVLAAGIAYMGVNPVKITALTMAAGAVALPFDFIPLLIVANDRDFMGDQKNTLPINIAAGSVLALLIVVTMTAIPLLILSGSYKGILGWT